MLDRPPPLEIICFFTCNQVPKLRTTQREDSLMDDPVALFQDRYDHDSCQRAKAMSVIKFGDLQYE